MTFIERAVDFELLPESERSDSGGDGRTLEGYAAVFDADTEINSWEGHFKERIAKGAFRKTLRERMPIMQFNHGHDIRFGTLPIGVYTDVKEDRHGLKVVGRLFESAEPIREAIAEGAVSGMSFKFKVVRDSWTDKDGNEIKDRSQLLDLLYGGPEMKKRGPLQRTIKEVKMAEAGPVVNPAYTQTSVGVRSADEFPQSERERLYALAYEGEERDGDGEAPEVGEPDVEAAREGLISAGFSVEQVDNLIEALRGENPFAKKDEKPKPGDKKAAAPCAECAKAGPGKKCEKHAKTSSDPKAKGEEKKSAEDDTEAPAVGSEAADDARSEDQDDAAQAGTSTGMTSNARERALRLLDI